MKNKELTKRQKKDLSLKLCKRVIELVTYSSKDKICMDEAREYAYLISLIQKDIYK